MITNNIFYINLRDNYDSTTDESDIKEGNPTKSVAPPAVNY